MHSCSLSQCQKWRIPKTAVFSKIPQVCFLSLKPLTQSKLFWNWGTVEWNYLFSWKLRTSWKILQPRTLCVPKTGLWNVTVARNRPIYMETDSSSFATCPERWRRQKYLCTWSEISLMVFPSYLIEGAHWSWVRSPWRPNLPDQIPALC